MHAMQGSCFYGLVHIVFYSRGIYWTALFRSSLSRGRTLAQRGQRRVESPVQSDHRDMRGRDDCYTSCPNLPRQPPWLRVPEMAVEKAVDSGLGIVRQLLVRPLLAIGGWMDGWCTMMMLIMMRAPTTPPYKQCIAA